nr:immunoglobulin light chain junction region [Macaca mulatta]MOW10205.1 immunoglobulin light chain junction region [Macaca mulatta]MOW11019.1 immunoglobulin light chain junction region [Macaca mulatta]MOW11060.1 immunoglobulin light chain junction region [Macaca mulatta]MOX47797.1 immunoglobulin light chain junction region [Macaca mulatta]
CLQYNSNPYSF